MVKLVKKNESGFSLIELMITVVIIGVLAAMGVPQYRRMVAKSRTAEAKVFLGTIATVEQTFFNEYGNYGNNIRFMGAAAISPQFYTAGFNSNANACAVNGATFPAALPAAPGYFQPAAVTLAETNIGIAPATNCYNVAAAAATQNTFTAFASGDVTGGADGLGGNCVSPAATAAGDCDVWSIDQLNVLAHVINGSMGL